MINKKNTVKNGKKLETEISKIARKNKFKVIRNSYIGFKSKGKQNYTEVDIILISQKGIVVIESKNFNATIKGNIEDKILKVHYNEENIYNMYNPILQNNTHKWAVSKYLNVNQDNIQSIIVFSESTNLEITGENIIKLNELDDILKSFKNKDDIYTLTKVNKFYNKLKKRTKVSKVIVKRHINQVKKKKDN